jgi:hypothetical protein
VEAILQYGTKLSPEDIQKAEKIAGSTFNGQLEENFCVIKYKTRVYEIPTPNGNYIQRIRGNGRGRGGRGNLRGNRNGGYRM